MSAYVKPCRGCPLREGCSLRKDFQFSASYINARIVTFDCELLAAELRPGRRIMIFQPAKIISREEDLHETYKIRPVPTPATIIKVRHLQFSAVIDRDAGVDAEFRYTKMRNNSRIARFLDEPDRALCRYSRPLIDGTCDAAGRPCHCNEDAALGHDGRWERCSPTA